MLLDSCWTNHDGVVCLDFFALNNDSSFAALMRYTDVLIFRLDALAKALSVIATATWLAGWEAGWLGGWVSVTLRYCIKTAKRIRKLFRPSESAIILVF